MLLSMQITMNKKIAICSKSYRAPLGQLITWERVTKQQVRKESHIVFSRVRWLLFRPFMQRTRFQSQVGTVS